MALWVFTGSFYHDKCVLKHGILSQAGKQQLNKRWGREDGLQRALEIEATCSRHLGGMSWWERVRQAKPTNAPKEDENHVVVAIIRPQDDENLEKVSCVPRGRLNLGDSMQKSARCIASEDVTPRRDSAV